MPHIDVDRPPEGLRPGDRSFIGADVDGAHQGRITMQGVLDAEAVDRPAAHLEHFLTAGIRFVAVDARGVIRADPALVPLLGRVQRRLTRRHGLLTMTGLHPSVLPTDDAPVVG